MSLTAKLTDKLEREIRNFCKFNNLQLGEYIAKCIEKQFNLDRYGDLNDKFLPIQMPEPKPQLKAEPPIEKPIEINDGIKFAEENIEAVNKIEEIETEKPKKRIRTIESK